MGGASCHAVRSAHVHPPAELGTRDGLSYALFTPDDAPLGGVVIVHGAGSCKESHFDFARACRAAGLAAVAFDQRGHGSSRGTLDGRAADDVAAMAGVLPAGGAGATVASRSRPRRRRWARSSPATTRLLPRPVCASACCSCTPRATSRCRSVTRANCTPPRPAAAWSSCRGATIARCSTTASFRRWRCGSSHGRARRRPAGSGREAEPSERGLVDGPARGVQAEDDHEASLFLVGDEMLDLALRALCADRPVDDPDAVGHPDAGAVGLLLPRWLL